MLKLIELLRRFPLIILFFIFLLVLDRWWSDFWSFLATLPPFVGYGIIVLVVLVALFAIRYVLLRGVVRFFRVRIITELLLTASSLIRLVSRRIWGSLGEAWLVEYSSSITTPIHPVLRWRRNINRFIRKQFHLLALSTIVLISVVGIPILQYVVHVQWAQFEAANPSTFAGIFATLLDERDFYFNHGTYNADLNTTPLTADVNFLDLALLGTLTAIIAISFWGALLYYVYRPRHIVMQFSVPEDEPALRPIASTLTHAFVDNLKRIGGLLALRQVETVATRLDDPLSLFVTSGQDDDLVRQLSSLSDFEASNIRVPLGGIASLLIFNLAQTRVRGNLQRGKDGNLEIWVELYNRGQRGTIEVGKGDLRAGPTGFVDERQLRQVAEELAIRLTYELGQARYLASSPQALRAFLNGLEATKNRNWLYAIDCFTTATYIEQAIRGVFAMGEYHIGTALLSQGSPELALEHLLRAVANGPTIAEMYYALAMAYLAKNADQLADDVTKLSSRQEVAVTQFNQVKHWLNEAIKLKPDFPEALHLLGSIHYQRGRLLERAAHSSIADDGRKRQLEQKSHDCYVKSIGYLRRSVHLYDRVLGNTFAPAGSGSSRREEHSQVMHARMLVTHHLADALRSVRIEICSLEAIEHYREIKIGLPGYLRNYIDWALTYCLMGRWEDAYKFLRDDVYILPEARVNADVSLYRGWAAAGIAKQLFQAARGNNANALEYLREAMYRFDQALALRPRFADVRRQTDWQTIFEQVIQAAGIKGKIQVPQFDTRISNPQSLSTEALSSTISLLRGWLLWRMFSFGEPPTTNTMLRARDGNLWKQRNRIASTLALHHDTYITSFFELRSEVADKLCEFDGQRRMLGLPRIKERLVLASRAYLIWLEFHGYVVGLRDTRQAEIFSDSVSSGGRQVLTFEDRWAWEEYAELITLTARLLAETGCYDILKNLTQQADILLGNTRDGWRKLWFKNFGGDEQSKTDDPNDFKFSHLPIRYKLGTVLAWKALAYVESQDKDAQKIIIQVEQDLRDLNLEHHPLFLYVRARHYRQQGRLQLAMGDLSTLLKIIEPFDPPAFEQLGEILDVTQTRESLRGLTQRKYAELSTRDQLYYMERVSGQQQFGYFIDKARVYSELAQLHTQDNDPGSAIHYLMNALTWSPYIDVDMDNLILLVESFYKQDRFREGLSALRKALTHLSRHQVLPEHDDDPDESFPAVVRIHLEVMECVLLTRLDQHNDSLSKGLRLAGHFIPLPKSMVAAQAENMLKKIEISESEAEQRVDFSVAWVDVKTGFSNLFLKLNHEHRDWLDGLESLEDPNKAGIPNYKNEYHELSEFQVFVGVVENLINVSDQKNGKEQQGDNQQVNVLPSVFDQKQFWSEKLKDVARKQLLDLIIEGCNLYNNLAYNLAKLGMELKTAAAYVWIAITIMREIRERCGTAALNYEPQRIEDTRWILKLDEQIAQFYDTLGWIYYRRRNDTEKRDQRKDAIEGKLTFLEKAEKVLLTSLQYDGGLGIPHYHLARVYVAMAEDSWQESASRRAADPVEVLRLSRWLRLAFHHWSVANRLDVNHRLETELRSLRDVLDKYFAFSERVQMTLSHDNDHNVSMHGKLNLYNMPVTPLGDSSGSTSA